MLQEQLRTAKREARPTFEVTTEQQRENKLSRKFLAGKLTIEAFRQLTSPINTSGMVLVNTLEEMAETLSLLGLTPEWIREEVGHEQAHWEKARELGFPAQLAVCLTKDQDGSHFHNVCIIVKIPPNINEETARSALKEIISAPGDDISSSDQESLPCK